MPLLFSCVPRKPHAVVNLPRRNTTQPLVLNLSNGHIALVFRVPGKPFFASVNSGVRDICQ